MGVWAPQVPLRSAIELDKKGGVCTGYFGKGITKSGLVRMCGCLSIIFLTDIRSHYFNNAALNVYPTEPKYPVIVNVQRLQQREIVLLLHFKHFCDICRLIYSMRFLDRMFTKPVPSLQLVVQNKY